MMLASWLQLMLLLATRSPTVTGDDGSPAVEPNAAFDECDDTKQDVVCYYIEEGTELLVPLPNSLKPTATIGFALRMPADGDWVFKIACGKEKCNLELAGIDIVGLESNPPPESNVDVKVDDKTGFREVTIKPKANTNIYTVADALKLHLKSDVDKAQVALGFIDEAGANNFKHKLKEPARLFKSAACIDPTLLEKPDPAAGEAKKDPVNSDKYSCEGEPTIYTGSNPTFEANVYCGAKGWISADGVKTRFQTVAKPYCWTTPPPLNIVVTCDNTESICIGPTSETQRIDKTGIYIAMPKADKKWTVTVAWPIGAADCKIQLFDKINTQCDTSAQTLDKVTIGKSKPSRNDAANLEQSQFEITALDGEENVFDVLLLYTKKDWAASMQLGSRTPPATVTLAPVCPLTKVDSTKATAELAEETNHNEFKCKGPLNNVIHYGNDISKDAVNGVICSRRGWRKLDHSFLEDAQYRTVFCYTDKTILDINPWADCTKTKAECWTEINADGESTRTTKGSLPVEKPGFALDMSKSEQWTMKITRKQPDPSSPSPCTIKIGSDLTFNCDRPKDDVQSVNGVKITQNGFGRNAKDHLVNIEQYQIESKDASVPIADALKMYLNPKQKIVFAHGATNIESEEITFVDACPVDKTKPDGALEIDKPSDNTFSCSGKGRFDEVFLGSERTGKSTIYCSVNGWRDENHDVLFKFSDKPANSKIYCFTNDPLKSLPMFTGCGPSKKCLTYDVNGGATLDALNTKPNTPKHGFEIDMSNEKEWAVTTLILKATTTCKLTIGPITFTCNVEREGSIPQLLQEKVTVTKVDHGDSDPLLYEKFTITPTGGDDPVADVLELYIKEASQKMILELETKKFEGATVLFENCNLNKPNTEGVSRKAQFPNRVRNKFECKNPLLNYIYLDGQKRDADSVYCSQRGWRKTDNTFLVEKTQEEPFCFTENPKKEIPLFTGCKEDESDCFKFEPSDQLVRIPKQMAESMNVYKMGLELAHSNKDAWTLVFNYETLKNPKIKIGDNDEINVQGMTVGSEDTTKIPGVKIKYEADGQDGTVFYHKFVFTPTTPDSLIDALQLYEKKEYDVKISFDDAKTLTAAKINFMPKCNSEWHRFTHWDGLAPVQGDHNKFECTTGSEKIFLDDKFTGEKVVFCSDGGWRGSRKTVIAEKKELLQMPFCYNRCSPSFMKKTSVPDKNGANVVPTLSADKYKCPDGAKIQVNNKYYTEVSCKNDEWKGDTELITFDKDKYKFTAECFGSFKFLHGNCDTPEKKEDGCVEPLLTADGVFLNCPAGFSLTLSEKIHEKLKADKGSWYDKDGKVVDAAGSAKPRCYSSCRDAYVDLKKLSGEHYSQAVYKWEESTNTGTLTCAKDILIFNVEGQDADYFDHWKCNGNDNKWTSGTKSKDLTGKTETKDLKFSARCFKACENKVIDDCTNNKAATELKCRPYKNAQYLVDKTLECDDNYVLFANGDEYSTKLECKKDGWHEKGGTLIPTLDHKRDKNMKLSVQCFDKCSKKFRAQDTAVEYDDNSNKMNCDGTMMISYTVEGTTKTTLNDLECHPPKGWKAIATGSPLLIDFKNGHKFEAKCVESCTPDLLNDECTSAIPQCVKPEINNAVITCPAGKVLQFHKKNPKVLEYKEIMCTKKNFEYGLAPIPRTDPNMKIDVRCISKCDQQFVKVEKAGTLEKPTVTDVAPDKYTLNCVPLQYTKFIVDKSKPSEAYYTAQTLECDPVKGWRATDIKPTPLFVDFSTAHVSNGEASCFDYCVGRHKYDVCPFAPGECGDPKYAAGVISCPTTHTMRIGDSDPADAKFDLIGEKLTCKQAGYERQSNKEIVHTFDNKDPSTKFDMYCFSNCKADLVKFDGGAVQSKKLTCGATELLTIKTATETRVFGDAQCVAAEGWKGETGKAPLYDATESKTVVLFSEGVRLSAKCNKVCSDEMITNACDAADTQCRESKYLSSRLSCDNHYRLLIAHGEEAPIEGEFAECGREGWKIMTHGVSELKINFKNPAVDFSLKVNNACKHKCHPDFIKDSCNGGPNCKKVTYESNTMSCKGATEILVLKHEGAIKESFEAATCGDEGWKDDKNNVMFALDSTKYHIEAKCEDVCHPNTLTGTNIGSRKYEVGGKLTCEDVKEVLVIESNQKWYTDLTCSKQGWTSVNDPDEPPKIAFTANAKSGLMASDDVPRLNEATCVTDPCYRPPDFGSKTDPCKNADGSVQPGCSKPDLQTKKYFMSCPAPQKIIRMGDAASGTAVTYEALYCENEIWYDINHRRTATPAPIIGPTDDLDVVCKAGDCALCEESLKRIECDGIDQNCRRIGFTKGSAFYCSNYKCSDGFYKVDGSPGKHLYYKPDTEIKCAKKDEFLSPDGMQVLSSAVGCVHWVPCIEHSPIDTKCTDLTVQCNATVFDKQLEAGSYYKTQPLSPVTCANSTHKIYHKTGDKVWSELTGLKCEKWGEWALTYAVPDPEFKKHLTKDSKERVVCADQNPSIFVPHVSQPCDSDICEIPPLLKCDGCKDKSKFTLVTENGVCKMTSTTKRITYNDQKADTKDPMYCKNTTGTFQWTTTDGTVVKNLAPIEREQDKVDAAMIGGVVGGSLLLLALIAGFIIYVRIHKKREAQRLETLKSKGLEQKNDTIIDSVTIIEDPKTIRL